MRNPEFACVADQVKRVLVFCDQKASSREAHEKPGAVFVQVRSYDSRLEFIAAPAHARHSTPRRAGAGRGMWVTGIYSDSRQR